MGWRSKFFTVIPEDLNSTKSQLSKALERKLKLSTKVWLGMLTTLDILLTLSITIIGFTIFANLIYDYRLLLTISKIVKKSFKVRRGSKATLLIPLTPYVKGYTVKDIVVLNGENIVTNVKNGNISIQGVFNRNCTLSITIEVYGRLSDYQLRRDVEILVFD